MGFLGRIFSRMVSQRKEGKIVLLGSSGAGKTTLVRYLETGEPVKADPKTTLGIDIRKTPINIDGWSFKAIDVGGQEIYQKTFWTLAISQANAIIYVIDGTMKPDETNANLELAQFQFEYMLNLTSKNVPLLILINKQDLKSLKPLTIQEAIELYRMDQINGRSFTILPSSAKYGDGVQKAMQWLVSRMS
ncbi:MAG: ADP-ribosylation factor-like protein [Candidatus Hodarchaeota archaeon]